MENSVQVFTTTVLTNMKGLVLTVTCLMSAGIILTILAMKFSLLFGLFFLISACLLLVIFEKQIRKNFVEEATVKLHEEYFSLTFFEKKSSISKKECNIAFSEINSIKVIESYWGDSPLLKIFLKDGTKTAYRFWGQNRNDGNIIPSILEFIKAYNATKINEEKIYLRKTFIASKYGYRLIIGVMVAAIVSLTIYDPPLFPALLIPSLLFFLDIWAQRQVDLQNKI